MVVVENRVMFALNRVACAAWIMLLVAGCDKKLPTIRRGYQFSVVVTGDPGQPVSAAVLSLKGEPAGTSNALGVVELTARGQEGETLELAVACPPGYRSPIAPLSVRLTRLSEASKRPEYQVSCAPAVRNVVVAVRAENGMDLPVKYLGQEVARTDASGAAHFLLRAAPGEQLEVQLDTRAQNTLEPQNPTVRFVTRAEDDVLLFDQPFVRAREARRAPAHKPSGPAIIRF